MRLTLQLEEMGQFVASIFILNLLPVNFQWWIWPIIFLAQDIGMIGYVINTKVGATTYNLFHHKLIALLIFVFDCLL